MPVNLGNEFPVRSVRWAREHRVVVVVLGNSIGTIRELVGDAIFVERGRIFCGGCKFVFRHRQ